MQGQQDEIELLKDRLKKLEASTINNATLNTAHFRHNLFYKIDKKNTNALTFYIWCFAAILFYTNGS